jgi:hypothetical protein
VTYVKNFKIRFFNSEREGKSCISIYKEILKKVLKWGIRRVGRFQRFERFGVSEVSEVWEVWEVWCLFPADVGVTTNHQRRWK